MKEIMIKTIKEDIKYMVNEIKNIRNKEELNEMTNFTHDIIGDERII